MTLQTLVYSTTTRLSCSCSSNALVYICLNDSGLLVSPNCADDTPQPWQYTTFQATILKFYKDTPCNANCGNAAPLFKYVLQYDDTILVDPITLLVPDDINGIFCQGCLTEWVKDQVGDEVFLTDNEDGSFTLTSQHGCEYEFTTGGEGTNDWHILGNSNIVDGLNFLGTTNDVAVDLRTNNLRALRLQPGDNTPHVIGGASFNTVSGVTGGDGNGILSGGDSDYPNLITTDCTFSVVGGGSGNNIDASVFSIIGGGNQNTAFTGGFDSILGGNFNSITSDDPNSANTVVGGIFNTISGAGAILNFIGGGGGLGGNNNTIEGGEHDGCESSVVVGGINNHVRDGAISSCVLGGTSNVVEFSSYASIAGGISNSIVIGSTHGFVGGGVSNTISAALDAAILGGNHNSIVGNYSAILGGGPLKLGLCSVGFQSLNGADPSAGTQRDLSGFTDIGYFGDIDLWVANSNGTARKLKFIEPNTDLDFSSANYSSFRAQAQVANIEYIWPAALPTAGQFLKANTVVGSTVTLTWA